MTVRETVTETAASSVPSEAPALVALYFPGREGLAGAARTGDRAGDRDQHDSPALRGTETELTSAIPPETRLRSLAIERGVASIELDPPVTDRKALAQIAYTLTQFESVKRVSFNGDPPVGRGAFEDETPAILVESPLSGEEVESGFEATGTANTFEATFQYELRDAADEILQKDFVTATSGSGTRGTFRFTVPYEGSAPGRLVVFRVSAEDGSRMNERSIPLSLR